MSAPPPSPATRPLGELLDAGCVWLRRRGIEEAALKCEWLAARLLRVGRLQLAEARSRPLPPRLVDALRRGIVRLGHQEPLQYVLGEWDFRGLTLKTDRRALIPRPETERLVQVLLDQADIWNRPAPRICDIGTGSGCIVISLAVEAPQGDYLAIDREAAALDLARENGARHHVADRIAWIQGESCARLTAASLDAVISNPPYIASVACDALEPQIRAFEPRSALDGGPDGLHILRDIIHDTALALKPGGWCFLEIGDTQGPAVHDLLLQAGFTDPAILPDLAGKPRYARAQMP